MSAGFLIDPWYGMLFFRYCMRFKVDDQQKKLQVLGRIVKKGKAKYLRDIGPAATGKKVLHITHKRNDNAN